MFAGTVGISNFANLFASISATTSPAMTAILYFSFNFEIAYSISVVFPDPIAPIIFIEKILYLSKLFLFNKAILLFSSKIFLPISIV